jgi:hypothetical protein
MEFKFNETTKIEFNLSIVGTQSKPSEVRVVLGTDVKQSFNAKSADSENFTAEITPIRELVSCNTQFSIEVIINGKIFTPIKRMINILDQAEQVAATEPIPFVPPVEDPVAYPEVAPYQEPTEVPIMMPEEVVEAVMPIEPFSKAKIVSVPLIKKEVPKYSVLENLERIQKVSEAKPSGLSKLKSSVDTFKPAPKKIELPKFSDKKPQGIEVAPEKVTKSIMVEACKDDPKKPTKKPTPKKVQKEEVQISNEPIFSIKKVEVIYK